MSHANRKIPSPAREGASPTPSVATVLGSAALWAWGFLVYLSPTLFPVRGTESSTGLEFGFFASQATVVVGVALLIAISRRVSVTFGRISLFVASLAMTGVSLTIPSALAAGASGVVIALGIISGVAVTLCGVAWGARYSVGSRQTAATIILSFLVAYALYLGASRLVYGPVGIAIVAALPLISWALWLEDATKRHLRSLDVFPSEPPADNCSTATSPDGMPGEMFAGSWEARVMPWRSMGVIVAAAFIGNLVSSAIMGPTYEQADSLYAGGIAVCACIATMALVPLSSERTPFSVPQLYRTTITFTAAGLLCILVFGKSGVPVGGALIQGCAMFLQALVYVVVARSTQQEGLAPLLSFGIGQALVSAVVLTGNVLGKQLSLIGTGDGFALRAACGVGVLVLFLMMADQAGRSAPHLASDPSPASSSAPETAREAPLEAFSATFGLTPREAEVLAFLARGRSLPYIADTLFVTTGTVKTHVKHIYRKCAVNTRQELLDLLERQK